MTAPPSNNALSSVVVRPTLPRDKASAMALCSLIWDGGDYIPYVWDEWMQSTTARMWTAELSGEVAGFIRLDSKIPGQYWLHGLRVHPKLQGQGIGRRLWDVAIQSWNHDGVIRLYTAIERTTVRHMAEDSGFNLITRFQLLFAKPVAGDQSSFSAVIAEESQQAVDFFTSRESMTGLRLVDSGWEWYQPTPRYLLDKFILPGRCWWWQGRQGLLMSFWDEWDANRVLFIGAGACQRTDLPEFVSDCQKLGNKLNATHVGWNVPLDLIAIDEANRLGFAQVDGEDVECLYELTGSGKQSQDVG